MKRAICISVFASTLATATACGSSQNSTSTRGNDSPATTAASPDSGADSKPDIPQQEVFFDRESHELDADARASLDDEVAWMKENPSRHVVIHGYAGSMDSPSDNLTLGNNRANAIREYLVDQGVEVGRISVVSHGQAGPDASPEIERRAVFASERY